jgi:GT2 family glycosyltransferase/glycosyltransferase involved in cell wall biosynthesis
MAALATRTGAPVDRRSTLVSSIDIIVAVYRGEAETRQCIESVLAHPQEKAFELIVVNDATPEPSLARWLREQAAKRRFTLIEQPLRQGFCAAVNRAVGLHKDRDVVLLHSDAEVANDWLDRLSRHADAAHDIGAVAPFASLGGVATYPRSGATNPLPEGHGVASLDLLFARSNAGASVEIPLAFGPCVYIKRDCLNQVGAFDGGPIGSDFGIEQDFCLRAGSAGFRHLLAADVYVWHHGSTSFGRIDAEEFARRTEQALERLFPRYRAQRGDFRERDPARVFQRKVDLLRLAESPRQLLLFISHAWGGGIRRHMRDLVEIVGERCEVLFLEPAVGTTVKLSWSRPEEGFATYFDLPKDMSALVALLRTLGLTRMHFHHVHGLPRAVLDLPASVGVHYDCTLHDYYAICPQYHLVTEDGRYCGEPDALGCAACLTRRPGQWGLDIATWRGVFGQMLRGADRVIAPSRDVVQRIGRYFPDLRPLVMPHPESHSPALTPSVRVVTLGNLSPEKGLRVVAACARDARARNLTLAFRVLGSTTEAVPQWPEAPLSIHGQYAEKELPGLIATERPDVIWFPAQVPETYSYTLSVALDAGVPIVASELGAFPERLAGYASAVVIRWDASPGEWNAALLRAGGAVPRVFPIARVAAS